MITLTLLHPIQSTPVQHWTFEQETVIRIGRSTDNQVILYSAVVSRHHVELRQVNSQWEVVNLGANGTYLNGKQITQMPVSDGLIIRLARSGPKIQIHLTAPVVQNAPGVVPSAEQPRHQPVELEKIDPAVQSPDLAVAMPKSPPITSSPITGVDSAESEDTPQAPRKPAAASRNEVSLNPAVPGAAGECSHTRAQGDMAFCPDCGQPLHSLQAVGSYRVMRNLHEDRVGVTQLVWRGGQSFVLKTLKPTVTQAEVKQLFEQRAATLMQLHHPGMPRFVDFFTVEDRPCLVMEQIYGQDLLHLVSDQGALSWHQALVTILQVCDVLSYIHQQSPPFLHQDLKPENLILQASPNESRIVVSGFLTLSHLTMDTQPALSGYIAPEQQQGYLSPTSDLFALGPILVYLLTGKNPNQFYSQKEHAFHFNPASIPGLTPDLVEVLHRLTMPDPEARYATAKEVSQALRQVSPQSIGKS